MPSRTSVTFCRASKKESALPLCAHKHATSNCNSVVPAGTSSPPSHLDEPGTASATSKAAASQKSVPASRIRAKSSAATAAMICAGADASTRASNKARSKRPESRAGGACERGGDRRQAGSRPRPRPTRDQSRRCSTIPTTPDKTWHAVCGLAVQPAVSESSPLVVFAPSGVAAGYGGAESGAVPRYGAVPPAQLATTTAATADRLRMANAGSLTHSSGGRCIWIESPRTRQLRPPHSRTRNFTMRHSSGRNCRRRDSGSSGKGRSVLAGIGTAATCRRAANDGPASTTTDRGA